MKTVTDLKRQSREQIIRVGTHWVLCTYAHSCVFVDHPTCAHRYSLCCVRAVGHSSATGGSKHRVLREQASCRIGVHRRPPRVLLCRVSDVDTAHLTPIEEEGCACSVLFNVLFPCVSQNTALSLFGGTFSTDVPHQIMSMCVACAKRVVFSSSVKKSEKSDSVASTGFLNIFLFSDARMPS